MAGWTTPQAGHTDDLFIHFSLPAGVMLLPKPVPASMRAVCPEKCVGVFVCVPVNDPRETRRSRAAPCSPVPVPPCRSLGRQPFARIVVLVAIQILDRGQAVLFLDVPVHVGVRDSMLTGNGK